MTWVRHNVTSGVTRHGLFADGESTYITTAVRFTCNECDCFIDFGVRWDNKEKGAVFEPCPRHPDFRDVAFACFQDSPEGESTEDALERSIERMEAAIR